MGRESLSRSLSGMASARAAVFNPQSRIKSELRIWRGRVRGKREESVSASRYLGGPRAYERVRLSRAAICSIKMSVRGGKPRVTVRIVSFPQPAAKWISHAGEGDFCSGVKRP